MFTRRKANEILCRYCGAKVGDAGIGNTWHHHQDGITLQAVDRAITHRGGVSIMKGNK